MSAAIESNMFLTFRLDTQYYGIEITRVREIVTYPEVTHIPDSKPWVKGVVDLRGDAVPIIDLRIRFSTANDPVYDSKSIVIATKVGNGKIIAYVVDEVSSIETVSHGDIMPATNQGVIDARFLKGYFKTPTDGKMVVVVDVEKLLSEDEMQQLTGGAL